MAFTPSQIATLFTGSNSNRVESLQKLLGYPSLARDAFGSRFWYLRPGMDETSAEETRPIAVGFYRELNRTTEEDTKSFFTSHEQLLEIYGHYLNRLLADKPVMYLLLPEETTPSSRVALILPTEGGRLRRRSIQTFACDKEKFFQTRLVRLRLGELPIAAKS